MKKMFFLFISCITVFIAINACSKEAIEDCLYGSGFGCMEVPIPPSENGLLNDGQIETDPTLIEKDSTAAVAKLPVRE